LALGSAIAVADPHSPARSFDWGRHGERVVVHAKEWWGAEEVGPALARWWQEGPPPGAGPWLPAAVLHLRDPQRFFPFGDLHRQGLATLDDGLDDGDPPAERYRLFNEACAWLRQKHGLHPLEVPDLLIELSESERPAEDTKAFGGLCADTFRFLE